MHKNWKYQPCTWLLPQGTPPPLVHTTVVVPEVDILLFVRRCRLIWFKCPNAFYVAFFSLRASSLCLLVASETIKFDVPFGGLEKHHAILCGIIELWLAITISHDGKYGHCHIARAFLKLPPINFNLRAYGHKRTDGGAVACEDRWTARPECAASPSA